MSGRKGARDGLLLFFVLAASMETGPNQNGRFLAKTMWKKPSPPRTSLPKGTLPQTPEALRSNETSSSTQPNQPDAGAQDQFSPQQATLPVPDRRRHAAAWSRRR